MAHFFLTKNDLDCTSRLNLLGNFNESIPTRSKAAKQEAYCAVIFPFPK